MSKVCKECGHQMDDNVQVCPNCGCPTNDFYVANNMSVNDSIEAEEVLLESAESILKWGKVVAIILSSFFALCFLYSCITSFKYGIAWMGFAAICIGVFVTIASYAFIVFISKACWAGIRIFVNMSKCLRRLNEHK